MRPRNLERMEAAVSMETVATAIGRDVSFGRAFPQLSREDVLARSRNTLMPRATRGSRHIVGVRDGIDHAERVPPVFTVCTEVLLLSSRRSLARTSLPNLPVLQVCPHKKER